MVTLSFIKSKIGIVSILLLSILLLMVGIIMYISGQNNVSDGNLSGLPSPTPLQSEIESQPKLYELQKTTIGANRDTVERLSEVEKKETLPDGSLRYSLKSPLISRKNEIIVKNGQVIYERILVPESRKSPGYVTISEYRHRLGNPAAIIRGSRFYGPLIATILYPEKGIVLIGNTYTDEVYEVHAFSPMTLEDYRSQFGQDIDETTQAPL